LVIDGKHFNYNTLEPKLVKANGDEKISAILGIVKTGDELHLYMRSNKTDCALKIFDSSEELIFPDYILTSLQ